MGGGGKGIGEGERRGSKGIGEWEERGEVLISPAFRPRLDSTIKPDLLYAGVLRSREGGDGGLGRRAADGGRWTRG